MPDEPKIKGTVVDFIGDEAVCLIFVNSDEEGLHILPLDYPPFEKWLNEHDIGPGDLIGRQCEFDDNGMIEFSEQDEE